MTVSHIRLGIVGLGGWGNKVARNFASARNCTLAYLCDANSTLLRSQHALYPQATATDSYDKMLADETLDAISVVTPAPMHYGMAKAALLAGKHVYIEKPMTTRLDEAKELVALAERQNRKLMVGHLLKYHPAVDLIKREIDSGSLGDVQYMYCQRLNLGVVRRDENAFWSLAPHDLSVVLHLFESEPRDIMASGQCFLQKGVEDVVFATLNFPEGRMAQIHVSWLDPHKERKMVVVGSRKMLVFDDTHPTEKVRIFDKGAQCNIDAARDTTAFHVRHGDIYAPHLPAAEPLAIETQHFVDAILDDTVPLSDGHDGVRVVRILEEVEKQMRGTLPLSTGSFQRPTYKIFAA